MKTDEATTPGARLEYLIREVLKTNPTKFNAALGLGSSGLIAKYIHGEIELTAENLNKIIELYPEFNEEWILTGAGNPSDTIKDRTLRNSTKVPEGVDELKIKLEHYEKMYAELWQIIEGQRELIKRLTNDKK